MKDNLFKLIVVVAIVIAVLSLVRTTPVNSSIGTTATLSYALGPGTDLWLPVIYKNAYGGWTTGINLTNTANRDNGVFIQYYYDTGGKAGQLGPWMFPNATWRISLAGADPDYMPDGTYSARIVATYPVSVVIHTTKIE